MFLPFSLPLPTAAELLNAAVELLKIGISAGALVGVAVLTAATTNRRQDRALAAEAERLRQQLRHDRTMTDLQELRTLLDAAATQLSAAADALVQAQGHTTLADPTDQSAQVEREKLVAAAQQRAFGLAETARRIRLRLTRDHDVYSSFYSGRDAIWDSSARLSPGVDLTDENLSEAIDGDNQRVGTALAEFYEASHRLIGSQTDEHS